MPLNLTPGYFRQRAEFYQQLAQLMSAGFGLTAGLQQLQRNPPASSYRAPIQQLLDQLAQGQTFSEALNLLGPWMPAFDISLLHAGEQSGRLDACLRLLADYYNERARIARQVLADLAYPVFLFHFAILIFGFIRWLSGTWTDLLRSTVGILLPIYVLVGVAIYAFQSRRGDGWRAALESILDPIPLLGTARRYLAVARLSAALEALLSAGVTIVEAWELAAAASGSPALRRTVLGWRARVDVGQTPAEVLRTTPVFPDIFVNQYATGEVSGQLDETLRRLHQYYQEEGSRRLHAVASWTPRAIYFAIMLMIAYRIVRFYIGYFHQIGEAGGF